MALDYKLMGERLKKARIQEGYTQEKLAEALKVSIAFISRIESGKTRINLKRLNEMCEILGITEGYVLDGASENSIKYLNSELDSVLKDCSSKDKELIYQIAGIISEKKRKQN